MLLRCVLLVALCCVFVGPQATAQVDQEHVFQVGFAGVSIAYYDLRQEFTPTFDQLDTVELFLAADGFTPRGSVAVLILKGAVDGTVLATSNAVHVPATFQGTVRFRFAEPVRVVPGELLALKPTPVTGDPNYDVPINNVGLGQPGYDGGRLFFNDGISSESQDIYFREGIDIPAVLTHSDPETARTLIEAGGTVKLAFDGTIRLLETISITTDTTVDATGRSVTIDGGGMMRHFMVTNGATLRLLNLTLINGRFVGTTGQQAQAGQPGHGGSIYSLGGTLELAGCKFVTNQVTGGQGAPPMPPPLGGASTDGGPAYGGAIYSENGTVSVSGCVFVGNKATGGIGVTGVGGYAGGGGESFGGAIYVTNATLTVQQSGFTNNLTQGGDQSIGVAGASGGGAYGGAMAIAAGTNVLDECVFVANTARSATKVTFDYRHAGDAKGGALFNQSGSLKISDTVFTNNTAQGGLGGSFSGETAVSGFGLGGAVCNNAGTVVLQNTALVANHANGGDSSGGPIGRPAVAGEGAGGAICNFGSLILTNCILARNVAQGGGGAPVWGNGEGGAVFNGQGSLVLVNVTVAENSAYSPLRPEFQVRAAGLTVTNGTVVLRNTILFSLPSQTNVAGPLTDGGHNLCSDESAQFTSPTSRMSLDPLLAPLAYNGGPTPTMGLLPASPAIDAGDDTAAPGTDQRGVSRPKGGASDIGAFELAPVLRMTSVAGETLQVDYVFQAGQTNHVSVTTNMANWSSLGVKVADTNGVTELEEVDSSQSPKRFYRLESWVGK